MKKIIRLFIFLFVINLPYKDLVAQEKDSVVVLPHHIALWYLERHELSKTLQIKMSFRDSIIIVYKSRIGIKDSIIRKERISSKNYRKIVKSLEKSKDTYKKDGKIKDKQIKKLKTHRVALGLLVVLITLLSII